MLKAILKKLKLLGYKHILTANRKKLDLMIKKSI